MSQRTIVEFNHDLWFQIDDDPGGFVAAILQMLRSGSNGDNTRDDLRRYGVQVAPTAHHTDTREANLGFTTWQFG